MRAQRTWQDLCVSILLAITSLAMVDHWALWLAQRNLVHGIKTVENNQYIVFHIPAATQAGLLTLLGAGGVYEVRVGTTTGSHFKEHDFAAVFRYTGGIRMDAKRLKDAPGLRGKSEEQRTMMVLAHIIPPLALHSFTLSGVLLATIGTIFLAYDLLGRENGPLRWFTLVMTCGIVSTLIFVPVVTFVDLLFKDVVLILPYILVGGLMGFYTVILVELPPSDTRPPLFSWKGGLLGLALVFLFWLAGVLAGPQYALPALTLGLACAILTSTWQRLTWDPAQAGAASLGIGQVMAGEEPSASTPTPPGTEQLVAWKPAHPRPHVFSRKGFLLGLLLVLIMWFAVFFIVHKDVIASLLASLSLALISGIICGTWRFISRKRLVLGLLLGFLLGFAFFFTANKDVVASLLESVPLALISGVICGTWRFLNWEPPHPRPQLFSRKGFWSGLVAGFVPWLLFFLAATYPSLANYTGPVKGFFVMSSLCIFLSEAGLFALANAVAGSIAQYTLWRANQLPHRMLGAIGLVLIVVALALQGVQPVIEILNDIK